MVHPKTLQAYKDAGVEFIAKGEDTTKDLYKRKTENDKNKKIHITEMQRFRDADGSEYILYEQDVEAETEISKEILQWHDNKEDTSIWVQPIADKRYNYDPETDTRKEVVVGVRREIIHYDIPFTKENAEKLKPLTNRSTEFNVKEGIVRKATYEDWLNRPFDELIAGYYNLNPEVVKTIKKSQTRE
jgi:hypothetical protein